MVRRWIIRGFFIGLLLLCVGGWAASYPFWFFADHPIGSLRLTRGALVAWHESDGAAGLFPPDREWGLRRVPLDTKAIDLNGTYQFVGFSVGHYEEHFGGTMGGAGGRLGGGILIKIPLWFPTTLAALLFCLVWRKTRPRLVGRAFPVEAKQAVEEKTP